MKNQLTQPAKRHSGFFHRVMDTAAGILNTYAADRFNQLTTRCPYCGEVMTDASRPGDLAYGVIECVNPDCLVLKANNGTKGLTYRRVDRETEALLRVNGAIEAVQQQQLADYQILSDLSNQLTLWFRKYKPEWLDGRLHPIQLANEILDYTRVLKQLPEKHPLEKI